MKYLGVFLILFTLKTTYAASHCGVYLNSKIDVVFDFFESKNQILIFENETLSMKTESLENGVWQNVELNRRPFNVSVFHFETSAKDSFFRMSELSERGYFTPDQQIVREPYFMVMMDFREGFKNQQSSMIVDRQYDVKKTDENTLVITDVRHGVVTENLTYKESVYLEFVKTVEGTIVQTLNYENLKTEHGKTSGSRVTGKQNFKLLKANPDLRSLLDIYFPEKAGTRLQ